MAITIANDMQLGTLKLTDARLEFMAKWFDNQHEEFIKKAMLVHRRTVFEVLIKIIKLCPVDTGRLRGSYLPYLLDRGQGGRASKIMQQKSGNEAQEPSETEFDPQEVQEGIRLGQYVDDAMSTTIATNVIYAMPVEKRVGFLMKALVWGQRRYNDNFDRFFDAAKRQGMIPDDDDETVDPSKGRDD